MTAESVLRCMLLKQHFQLRVMKIWRFICWTRHRSRPLFGCPEIANDCLEFQEKALSILDCLRTGNDV